jgi:hypothetical protein
MKIDEAGRASVNIFSGDFRNVEILNIICHLIDTPIIFWILNVMLCTRFEFKRNAWKKHTLHRWLYLRNKPKMVQLQTIKYDPPKIMIYI